MQPENRGINSAETQPNNESEANKREPEANQEDPWSKLIATLKTIPNQKNSPSEEVREWAEDMQGFCEKTRKEIPEPTIPKPHSFLDGSEWLPMESVDIVSSTDAELKIKTLQEADLDCCRITKYLKTKGGQFLAEDTKKEQTASIAKNCAITESEILVHVDTPAENEPSTQ